MAAAASASAVQGREMRNGAARAWSCGPRSTAGPHTVPGTDGPDALFAGEGMAKTVAVRGRVARRLEAQLPAGKVIWMRLNSPGRRKVVSLVDDGTPRLTVGRRICTAPSVSRPGMTAV
jgi:hypothetical protein